MPTLRLAVVTNIPAPYRVPVFDLVAARPGIELLVVYAARTEPDRRWDLPPFAHEHRFLAPRMHERGGRFIHSNPDVWPVLAAFDPQVVITTGFNPTHLLAWLFCVLRRRRHVVMTDGTDASEARLGRLHRTLRRVVFATTRAFVVASEGGRRLLRGYGVADEHIHFSPLCANERADWAAARTTARDVDLLFSGRLVKEKNPAFALDVAAGAARVLQRPVSIALLGSGPLEAELRARAQALAPAVDARFAGHVAQAALPAWYARARLFLFPSAGEPWGVVANEACMAGTPVIVSPQAGVAGELVIDGVDGRVLPLDAAAWTAATAALLADDTTRQAFGAAARQAVQRYSFDNAAAGIVAAAASA